MLYKWLYDIDRRTTYRQYTYIHTQAVENKIRTKSENKTEEIECYIKSKNVIFTHITFSPSAPYDSNEVHFTQNQ